MVAAAILLMLAGFDATVETTCKAAADEDAHVNYVFCVSELSKHYQSSDADTWGLAKIAANMGVINAYGTIHDIERLLARPGTDAKTKVALGQCQGLHVNMKFAFAGAYDEINGQNYAAGKEEGCLPGTRVRRCLCEGRRPVASQATWPLLRADSDSLHGHH